MIALITGLLRGITPTLIMVALTVFVGTRIWSGVTSYFETQAAVKPWIEAVKQRDEAFEVQDKIVQEALKARENFAHENAKLQAELEAADIARQTASVAECTWSDYDIRVLNTGTE